MARQLLEEDQVLSRQRDRLSRLLVDKIDRFLQITAFRHQLNLANVLVLIQGCETALVTASGRGVGVARTLRGVLQIFDAVMLLELL